MVSGAVLDAKQRKQKGRNVSVFGEIAKRVATAQPRGVRSPRLEPGEYIVRIDSASMKQSQNPMKQGQWNVTVDGRVLVVANGASQAGSSFGWIISSAASFSFGPDVKQLVAACLGIEFEKVGEAQITEFFEKGQGSGKTIRVRAMLSTPKPGSNKQAFLNVFPDKRVLAKDYANALTEEVVKAVFGEGDLEKGKALVAALIASGM